jgi:nucleoside-diphosphate-sugar epimerase
MGFDKGNSRILVTGASGFVGQHLCATLAKLQIIFIPVVRKSVTQYSSNQYIADINEVADWTDTLTNVSCIVHLAGHVHKMDKVSQGNREAFFKTNYLSTILLAKQAAKAGVKRFVFVSSLSVYGTHCSENLLDELTPCKPLSHYASSKYEAELALLALSKVSNMEVVIIRPPLVYGPGNKGNFQRLINLVCSGVPLPFGNVNNKRSFGFVDNLVDLIINVLDHPKAAGQVFLVSDDEDVSTTRLLKTIASKLGKQNWLMPIPALLLKALLVVLGRRGLSDRLLGSLQLDISKTKFFLDWKPPVSFDEGIKKTTMAYLDTLR